jgi:predicted dehydrogenase
MKKLNIAMIGYGGIGRVHLMGYRNIPFHYGLPADTVNILGVATTSPETAKRAAKEIGCDLWTDNYHELLARNDINIVDCCVPNHISTVKNRWLSMWLKDSGWWLRLKKPALKPN